MVCQLGCVHADRQHPAGDVGERRGEPLCQPGAALRDHLESGAAPSARVAVEDEDPA
jgi:hypothetical protein